MRAAWGDVPYSLFILYTPPSPDCRVNVPLPMIGYNVASTRGHGFLDSNLHPWSQTTSYYVDSDLDSNQHLVHYAVELLNLTPSGPAVLSSSIAICREVVLKFQR